MKHYLKKAIRLSNYLSSGGEGVHCLQISRTVLALSLYVIVFLFPLCLADSLCAVMSGREAMLC